MARRTYGANQDMDSYRRSGRSAIQVQSHPRPYAPANHSQPPPHEPSEDGADNSPRRRIALAVRVFLWSYQYEHPARLIHYLVSTLSKEEDQVQR